MPYGRCETAVGGPLALSGLPGSIGETGAVRVLLIEDEVGLTKALSRGLTAEGFTVDVAHDGLDGFHLASEGEYAAIVLDIMLPGMNGYQVCRKLRESAVWTPILMLTAKTGEYDEAEALDTGADDFLRKPFSHLVLVARIRALLRRGKAERAVQLSAGGLRVNPSQRRAWRDDDEIELTAREFAVLEYLISNVGTVRSKAEILDHVWDYAFDGDPNIVEVYVRHLRKKIDIPYGTESIQTVRGAGYRLVGTTS